MPELKNSRSHKPAVVDENSVTEQIWAHAESEEGDGAFQIEKGGPIAESEGREPHFSPLGVGSFDRGREDTTKTVGNRDMRGADSAIETSELTSQDCFDRLPELFADGRSSIRFDNEVWSFSNQIKGLIEDFIGVPIYWWPLSARRVPLPHGFSRAMWTCVRGDPRVGGFLTNQLQFSVVEEACQSLCRQLLGSNMSNGFPLAMASYR